MVHIDDVVNCAVRILDLDHGGERDVFGTTVNLSLVFDPSAPKQKQMKGTLRGEFDNAAKVAEINHKNNEIIIAYINNVPVSANTPAGMSAASYTQQLTVDTTPRKGKGQK